MPHGTVRECSDLPSDRLQQIELFFRLYRLPGRQDDVNIDGWDSAVAAWQILERSRENARD